MDKTCREKNLESALCHLAVSVIGWLITMSYYCHCSYLRNFSFIFWQTEAGSRGAPPIIPVCPPPSFRSTLDYILRRRGELAKVKIPFGDSTVPAAYGHMLTLHLSHHP